MGGGPRPHLHVDGTTFLHRLPAHAKLVGLLALVLAVVALPGSVPWAFGVSLAIAFALLASTRVPWRSLLARMVVEVPFLAFALLLPFVASGPRTELGPVVVSEPGLHAAWQLLAKASVGVMAAVAFATTTEPRDLVRGLQTLRLPGQLVQILTFMVRYLGVVGGELSRMRVARESRGFQARSVRAWPALASSTGALFIRSYERGERVHLAMLSRGYTGTMPELAPLHHRSRDWVLALTPALVVLACGAAARLA